MAEPTLSTDSPALHGASSDAPAQNSPKQDSPAQDTSAPSALLTRAQCRAARALLCWTQSELARRARISAVTVRTFERGQGSIKGSTARLLRLCFEAAGVLFIDAGSGGDNDDGGPGARLAQSER